MVFTVSCLFISFLFMNKCTKSTYLEDSEIVWCVCMPSYDLIVSVSICYLLLLPVVLKSGFPAPHIRVFEGEREGRRERKCAWVCAHVFDWTRVDVHIHVWICLITIWGAEANVIHFTLKIFGFSSFGVKFSLFVVTYLHFITKLSNIIILIKFVYKNFESVFFGIGNL
jgi:hypothetical protein